MTDYTSLFIIRIITDIITYTAKSLQTDATKCPSKCKYNKQIIHPFFGNPDTICPDKSITNPDA